MVEKRWLRELVRLYHFQSAQESIEEHNERTTFDFEMLFGVMCFSCQDCEIYYNPLERKIE